MGAQIQQIAVKRDLYKMCSSLYSDTDDRAVIYATIGSNNSYFTITGWTTGTSFGSSNRSCSNTISSGSGAVVPAVNTYMYVSGTTTYGAFQMKAYETVQISVTATMVSLGTSSGASNIYSGTLTTTAGFYAMITSSSSGTTSLGGSSITIDAKRTSVSGSGSKTTTFTFTNNSGESVTRYIRIYVANQAKLYSFKTSSSGSNVSSGTLYTTWKFSTAITRDMNKAVKCSQIYPKTDRKSSVNIYDCWNNGTTLSGNSLYALYGSYNYSSSTVGVTASLRTLSSTTNIATASTTISYNDDLDIYGTPSVQHASFGTSNARMYVSLTLPSVYLLSSKTGQGNITGVLNVFDVYVYCYDTDGNEYIAGQGTLSTTRTYTKYSHSSYDRYASGTSTSSHIGIVPSKREIATYVIKIRPSYEFITSSTSATSEVGEWEDDTE